MLRFIFLTWAVAFSLLPNAYGASTTLGHTYPIQEQDLLIWIKNKAQHSQTSGNWPHIQQQWQTQAQSKAERPTPVAGLSVTTQERRWLFDPSITLQQPIKQLDGTVLIHRGTRVNPLHTVPLKTPLIFYNADDPKQVSWAECQWKRMHLHSKLILVGGNVAKQSEHFHTPVYFDQGGRLVQHLGIRHTPAVVTQQGERLLIRELIPLCSKSVNKPAQAGALPS